MSTEFPRPLKDSGGRADPHLYLVETNSEDGEGDEAMVVTRLALRYVTSCRQGGHLNERSADQVRSRLLDFARSAPRYIQRVRRSHVERWMERPDLSPAYRRSRLSTLRGFFRWCVGRGYVSSDPTLLVRSPRVPEGVPKRLTRAEATALAATARRDLRTLLIVLLMLQEGLRRIEISRANVEDVDFAERTLAIRGKGGGGSVTRTSPLSDETWRVLRRYLLDEPHAHGPLVRNRVRKHGRLSPQTVSELVHHAMVDAGIKQRGDPSKTPHSCRHTFCHDVLATTDDIFAAKQAMGHASVRTTEVYLRGHVANLREIMGGRSYLDAAC